MVMRSRFLRRCGVDAAFAKNDGPAILHVTTVHQPFDTRIFFKEALSLVKAGYRVHLATTVDKPTTEQGVQLLPLGSLNSGARILRLLRNLRALKYVLRRYDIVHLHDPELLVIGGVAAALGRCVVFDIHEYYHERIRDSLWIPPFLRRTVATLYRWVESLVLPLLSGLVVVTEDMLSSYRHRTPSLPIALVRNFPSLDAIERQQVLAQPPPLNVPYIIHTGGASKERSFHVVVQTAEALRAADLHLPIVNLGPIDLTGYPQQERTTLLQRAAEAGVQVLGAVSFGDALRWVAHARIAYMPLFPCANNVLGLPNKIFEFFLFGKPVVACDFGRVKSILEETGAGLLVEPENAKEHAAAITRLLVDDELYDRLSRASAQAGQRYSFDSEVAALRKLYADIGSRRRP